MDDYISREAAIENFMQYTWYDEDGSPIDDCDTKRDTLEDMFSDIPAADVRPVKEGQWLTWEDQFPGQKPTRKNGLGVFCDQCHKHADNTTDFCPNCGAKMGGTP